MPSLGLRRNHISIVLALAAALALYSACISMDFGTNSELRRIPSPDGRFVAVVFSRDWGATVAKARIEVSVLRAGAELPNVDGNAFSSHFDPWVKWRDMNTLEVGPAPGGVLHTRSLWVRTGALWWSRVSVTGLP